MTNNLYIPLTNRSVLSIKGTDSIDFLQRLLTNNIEDVSKTAAVYSLMLTPQGKFLFDLFIAQYDDALLIDCATSIKQELVQKLAAYKLRSDIIINDLSDSYEVVALIGEKVFEKITTEDKNNALPFCKGIAYIDPRDKALFARSFIKKENNYQSFIAHEFAVGDFEEYEDLRISNLIPCGINDLTSGKSFPLDFGINKLHAIDYQKGCYIGQEVTARTHHRGTLRKKLYHITSELNTLLPIHGTNIINKEGKKLGIMLSSIKNRGIALLNINEVENCSGLAIADDIALTIEY